MEHTKKLIAYLKVTGENLKTLHRHLKGGSWQEDHELIGEYYEKLDEITDNVVETMIGLGFADVSMSEAIEMFPLDPARNYLDLEAFARIKRYFERLIVLFTKVKENSELPTYVVSKFEEHEYYLFLEASYKLQSRLNKSDMSYLFKND